MMHQYAVRSAAARNPSHSHAVADPQPLVSPNQARADTLGHRFSSSSAAPIQLTNKKRKSKYASKSRIYSHIYTIRKRANNKVVYVGQTDQTINQRWRQHLRTKKWLDEKKYKIKRKRSGNYTPFKLSCYEQYYIDKYGGVGKLRNKINAITKKKYNQYKGKHKSLGHRAPY